MSIKQVKALRKNEMDVVEKQIIEMMEVEGIEMHVARFMGVSCYRSRFVNFNIGEVLGIYHLTFVEGNKKTYIIKDLTIKKLLLEIEVAAFA